MFESLWHRHTWPGQAARIGGNRHRRHGILVRSARKGASAQAREGALTYRVAAAGSYKGRSMRRTRPFCLQLSARKVDLALICVVLNNHSHIYILYFIIYLFHTFLNISCYCKHIFHFNKYFTTLFLASLPTVVISPDRSSVLIVSECSGTNIGPSSRIGALGGYDSG